MTMPFSIEDFFGVFARYNDAIWPVQLVAYAAGIAAIALLFTGPRWGRSVVLAILALFWAWNGIAYHWLFFAEINPAAYGFGTLFVVQAVFLAVAAVKGGALRIDGRISIRSVTAWALIIYATIIYEALGYVAGHGLLNGPLFGVAPCPTTIFTIGVLLLFQGRSVVLLALIPIIWALVGTSAAILLDVPEDLGLAVAAFAMAGALLFDPQRCS